MPDLFHIMNSNVGNLARPARVVSSFLSAADTQLSADTGASTRPLADSV